jgi:predicted ATPase
MISRLHVENYKCLRDVSVDLGPFTVLIGANDSGKSSILDAIRVIGRTTREPIADSFSSEDQGGTFDELVWRRSAVGMAISVSGAAAGDAFEYTLKLRAPDRISERLTIGARRPIDTQDQAARSTSLSQIRELEPFVSAFASTIKYCLEPRALCATRPFQSKPVLTSSGDNLPEALDALITGPDRTAIIELEKALHAVLPTLSGVSLRTLNVVGGIGKEIHFTLAGTRPPITVRPVAISQGALLLLAFLVLAYGESPEILLVEEPENGLHPTRLQTVIDLLRAISVGAVGNRPRQVIMTTHSPLLLNYVKPEEVRIVRRDLELGTSVTPMTAVPNLDKLLKEFAVGELWYLLTEEGLLKGASP